MLNSFVLYSGQIWFGLSTGNELRLVSLSVCVHVFEKSLYPSSSFWKTYHCRLNETSVPSSSVLSVENRLCLLHNHIFDNLIIECGEIDGIVLESWMNTNESSSTLDGDEEDAHVGYWAAAAVWFDAWDQRTVDRVSCFSFFLPHVCVCFVIEY